MSRNDVWATENWRRIFAFPPETAIRYETVIERIHPQDRETVEHAVRRAIENQDDYLGEYRVVLPDGTERWIAVRGRLCADSPVPRARLLGMSVDITERKRAELALEERLRFEQLLTGLSAKFINQPPDQIDGVIDDSLTRLLEAIRNGKTLFFKCLPDDFPPEAVKERDVCLAQGIKSTVAIPLSVVGSVLGIISFSFLRRYCEWCPEIVSRLQVIAEIFANALMRKRSDEAIRAALVENEQLRVRLERENVYLREQITLKHHHGRIIGKSRALKKVLSEAERVADADTPVLLLGETGTGSSRPAR